MTRPCATVFHFYSKSRSYKLYVSMAASPQIPDQHTTPTQNGIHRISEWNPELCADDNANTPRDKPEITPVPGPRMMGDKRESVGTLGSKSQKSRCVVILVHRPSSHIFQRPKYHRRGPTRCQTKPCNLPNT